MPNKQCIIFLDVDGVLNTGNNTDIDPEIIKRLKRIVDQFHVQIVLSSMWRIKKENRALLYDYFERYGLPKPISCTPCINDGHDRAMEIITWLYLNTDNMKLDYVKFEALDGHFKEKYYKLKDCISINQFVVIDDLNLRDERFGEYTEIITKHNFVRTVGRVGFTEQNASQVAHIFKHKNRHLRSLLPAAHCEYCQKQRPMLMDKTANKYFCQSPCQKLFYNQFNL